MKIVVWVEAATWPAAVDAARSLAAGQDIEFELIHVIDTEATGVATGAFGGLMGRGQRRDPGKVLETLSVDAANNLVREAAARLDRPCRTRVAQGRPERIVTGAVGDADYLVLARNGDRSRLGPSSLVKHTRFVVDHAPCRVLLIWPETVPDLDSIPPPPLPGNHPGDASP